MKLIFKGLRRQLGEVPCLVKVANQQKADECFNEEIQQNEGQQD